MAEDTNHYFKHLGVSDGLSQVCIPSIYQDELGAVWLGTTEGLNRYNGKDVKVFQPSESNHGLTNNEINELCGDKNGRMYIRSGNDLIKLDIYTEQFTCLRQKGVYGLFCKKDTLWVSCADGIYYYTGQGTELTFFARVQKGFVGRALYVDKETVWVVTRKYLVAISRLSLIHISSPNNKKLQYFLFSELIFAFRVLGEPAFSHPVFLLKDLFDGPERGEGKYP